MDVYNIYAGDCSSFRNTMYRDYEKFPYGSFEGSLNAAPTKNYYNSVQGEIFILFEYMYMIYNTWFLKILKRTHFIHTCRDKKFIYSNN